MSAHDLLTEMAGEMLGLRGLLCSVPPDSAALRLHTTVAIACVDALQLDAVAAHGNPDCEHIMPSAALLVDAVRVLQIALLHTKHASMHYELYWRVLCVEALADDFVRALATPPCQVLTAPSRAPRASNSDLLMLYVRLRRAVGKSLATDALLDVLLSLTPADDDIDALSVAADDDLRAHAAALSLPRRRMVDALLECARQMRKHPDGAAPLAL